MKKLKQTAIYFLLASLLSAAVNAQTSDQKKIELVFQGDIDSFSNELNIPLADPFALSADGKQIATVWRNKIVLWDVETGKVLRTFSEKEYEDGVFTSIAISHDKKILAGGFYDPKQIGGRVKFWDLHTGEEIDTTKHDLGFLAMILGLEFSPEQDLLISTTLGVLVFDKVSGATNLIKGLQGGPAATDGWDYAVAAAFSPNGKSLFWKTSEEAQANDSYLLRKYKKKDEIVFDRRVSINDEGEFIWITRSGDVEVVKFIYDEKTEEGDFDVRHTFKKEFSNVFFNPQDGNELIFSQPGKIIKRNLKTNAEVEIKLENASAYAAAGISRNGKIVTNGIQIWDANSGRLIQDLSKNLTKSSLLGKSLNLENDKVFIGKEGENALVWDLKSGGKPTLQKNVSPQKNFSFNDEPLQSDKVRFSFNSMNIVNLEYEGRTSHGYFMGEEVLLKHFDAANNILTVVASGSFEIFVTALKLKKYTYEKDVYELETVKEKSFSLNVGYRGHVPPPIRLDELALDKSTLLKEIKEFENLVPGFVRDLHIYLGEPITADGRFRIKLDNNKLNIYNRQNEKLLASLAAASEEDWIVITPDGRFDASDGALKSLHYVYGLEIINLEQLKEAYYEPGLLQKLLGYSKEPLRLIVPLENVKLFPEVVEQKYDEQSGKLTVKLKNRGGGIGETRVLVNGKLAVADARDERLKNNPLVADGAIIILTVDLSAASFLKGEENNIEVVTSNYLPEIKKGNIQSRGSKSVYVNRSAGKYELPSLYAIIGGVSDYEGDELDLRFAAKDAEDFSAALSLGAKRLFCPKENPNCLDKVQITTLSTSGAAGTVQPTKENFRKAFADIASKAKPEDIVVIYLSGHGVSFGAGTDTYFYLTKEARSSSNEDLTKVYQTAAISSVELTEWLTTKEWSAGNKGIKALKQVLILDTCAAGQAAAQLALTQKRDLSGDQIRAIEFLKDKTGTFVLMGSTADAPSYEASQYGQGLLTYSLLQAMKGADLDRGEYIDVRRLFTYAEQTVPRMALNIGGVQKPIVSAPLGKTFVIGQMTEAEKKQIELPQPKPIILRPQLGILPRNNDPLNLTAALRKSLDAESSYEFVRQRGGKEPILIYVDDDSFPDAIQISGSYKIEGELVKAKIYLFKGEKEIAELEEISAPQEKIVEKMLDAVRAELAKLK